MVIREQNPDHDESVLNPEQVNEADLSRKERRLLEKEKLKGMGFGKKMEYIWMYYKWAIFGIILLICFGFFMKDWYHNSKMVNVLSISAASAGVVEAEPMEAELKEMLGYDDEYSYVQIATNLSVDATGEAFDYNAQMAYVAQLQTGTIDALIVPETVIPSLSTSDQPFQRIDEVVDEETLAKLGDRVKGTYIALEKEVLNEEYSLWYEPACILIPFNAPNPENVEKWISYLADGLAE